MPLYTYRCDDCDSTQDAVRTIDNRDDCPECLSCGELTHKIITPTQIAPQFQSYKAVAGDQRWIHSKSQHNNFLKENSLTEVGNDQSMK